MWVKICATTSLEDALLATDAGADAVGFVFAKSARRVTSEQVAEIVTRLPRGVEKVGVFSSTDPHEVEHHVACSGLTAAQLHGVFDGGMVRALSNEFGGELKILQTIAYAADAIDQAAEDARVMAEIHAASAEPAVWAILLDTAVRGHAGGTGVPFDWGRAAAALARVQPAKTSARLIVAGGLNPANVAQAIASLRPWGVDVASGVEASKGKKDAARVRSFVAAAKA